MLHGATWTVRMAVFDELIAAAKPKTACRFALCGFGDQLTSDGQGGVGVQPRGCGHKLCARCGRKRAARHARKVLSWLAYADHGDLFNVTFTQPVMVGETLAAARARMEPKLRRFMRWATRVGMTSALVAHHLKWSERYGGWHYHVHGLLEFPADTFTVERAEGGGEESGALGSQWQVVARGFGEAVRPLWNRRLVQAGGAIRELAEDSGDPDFWSEGAAGVARVVQYPLRDLCQGMCSWRISQVGDEQYERAREVARSTLGWRMNRCWGRWRHKCPAAVAAELAEKADQTKKDPESGNCAPGAASPLGFVHRIWKMARGGDAQCRAWLKALERTCRNDTEFARRLVAFVRAAVDPPLSG